MSFRSFETINKLWIVPGVYALYATVQACGIDSICLNDADCTADQICDKKAETCRDMCSNNQDCGEGLNCLNSACISSGGDFALQDLNRNSPTFNQERRLSEHKNKLVILYFSRFD